MMYLIIIAWYLVGSFGMLYLCRRMYPVTTLGGLIICFTAGGLFGLYSVMIGIIFNDWDWKWANRKLF